MSIRNLIDRFLDSEFGALPATRGVGYVVLDPAVKAEPSRARELNWQAQPLATAR